MPETAPGRPRSTAKTVPGIVFRFGTEQDMDTVGAVPDMAVDNLPGEDGRDRQLEAAVEALLGRLPR